MELPSLVNFDGDFPGMMIPHRTAWSKPGLWACTAWGGFGPWTHPFFGGGWSGGDGGWEDHQIEWKNLQETHGNAWTSNLVGGKTLMSSILFLLNQPINFWFNRKIRWEWVKDCPPCHWIMFNFWCPPNGRDIYLWPMPRSASNMFGVWDMWRHV